MPDTKIQRTIWMLVNCFLKTGFWYSLEALYRFNPPPPLFNGASNLTPFNATPIWASSSLIWISQNYWICGRRLSSSWAGQVGQVMHARGDMWVAALQVGEGGWHVPHLPEDCAPRLTEIWPGWIRPHTVSTPYICVSKENRFVTYITYTIVTYICLFLRICESWTKRGAV